MSDVVIAVIGAGVIGTSIGLALKQLEDKPKLIVHDKKGEHTRQAVKMGAFDQSEWNLINACDGADLVILAIPTAEIRPTLEAIGPELKKDAIVSDTAQTKRNIVEMAQEILPEHVHFIGGNPIVGTINSGPEYARADLFKGMLYCLTPTAKVLPDAVNLLEDMVTLIGATPFFLDPVEHDGLLSGVNGLPTLLSIALMNVASRPVSWHEMRKLAGGLFSQVSSGAVGEPHSLTEEFIENKENTLRWLEAYMAELESLKALIKNDDNDALIAQIESAVNTRAVWQRDFEQKRLSDLTAPPPQVEKQSLFKQLFGFGNR